MKVLYFQNGSERPPRENFLLGLSANKLAKRIPHGHLANAHFLSDLLMGKAGRLAGEKMMQSGARYYNRKQ
jgi:hypothetical protein